MPELQTGTEAELRCLVINLDRSPERLAHMQGMFGRIGMGFERVPAVDGARCEQELIDAINARNCWLRPMVRAEVGCFLSHRACWQSIGAGTEPFGAVFEDDVLISSMAATLLRSSQWIPKDADFIKLETCNRSVVIARKSQAVAPHHKLARLSSFHEGLGGYIVSKQCAQRLCAQTEHRTAPVDQLVQNPQYGIFDTLKAFQLMPSVCIQTVIVERGGGSRRETIRSTIDPDGVLYGSDHQQLSAAKAGGKSRALRRLERIAASLRRALRGQRKTRVAFR